jgi:tRNA-splicing ligase RtcB
MDIQDIRSSFKETYKNTWDSKSVGNVPIRVYANKDIFKKIEGDVFKQATNAANLPGIIGYSYLFSDAHIGYGVPVGWMGAFDAAEGIISPGIVGFDINCGMRLIRTNMSLNEVKPKIKELIDTLFKIVPAGVGSKSTGLVPELKHLNNNDMNSISEEGIDWAIRKGYATKKDKERIEERGVLKYAEFSKVSKDAVKRGKEQLGTLGSGNHYLEVQTIKEDFNKDVANKLDLDTIKNQVVIMLHTGSRGFGHQIASDYISRFLKYDEKNKINLDDKQLAYASFNSDDGQDYLKAMACAANFSFVNRQLITHQIREAFKKTFKKSENDMGLEIVYDVAHNTAKTEEHIVNGRKSVLVVHRKGATRNFGPKNKELNGVLKSTGQPVIIGGSMETGSYLCVGTKKSELESFGTTLHGSGRTMSRVKAREVIEGKKLVNELEKKGIYVKSNSLNGLIEEGGAAYKDIDQVVNSMHDAGISLKVLKLVPIGNIKG